MLARQPTIIYYFLSYYIMNNLLCFYVCLGENPPSEVFLLLEWVAETLHMVSDVGIYFVLIVFK